MSPIMDFIQYFLRTAPLFAVMARICIVGWVAERSFVGPGEA